MYSFNFVTWLIFVTVFFRDATVAEDGDIVKWNMYRNLLERYQAVIEDIAHTANQVNAKIVQLANETFASFNHRISGKLKTKFPNYCADWIDGLMGNVSSFFSVDYPTPCFRPVEVILDDIYGELTRTTREIEPITNGIGNCSQDFSNCDFSSNFYSFQEKINDLKNRWLQYQKNDLVGRWANVKRCYDDLSSSIELKLLNSNTSETCQCKHTYREFLERSSLWPVHLYKFTGKDYFWFSLNHRGFRGWESKRKANKMHKSNIENLLKDLKNIISHHLQDYLVPRVNKTINDVIAEIQKEIKALTNIQIVKPSKSSCYKRMVEVLLNEVNSYYRARMKKICFGQLLDSKKKLLNILECDLENIEERMIYIGLCWEQEACQEVILKLKQIQIMFHLWSFHYASIILDHGKECYSKTSDIIYKNLANSMDDLMECHSVHLTQGLLKRLPVNSETNEIYVKSEVCRNQTEDHFDDSTIYQFM